MNNFKGGFGGFGGGNLQGLMRQAQKMQEDMQKAKEEIESTEFKATAGGGMVECIMMGDRTLKSIVYKSEIVDPEDTEMLQDLTVAVINDCLNQIKQTESAKLPNLPAGM